MHSIAVCAVSLSNHSLAISTNHCPAILTHKQTSYVVCAILQLDERLCLSNVMNRDLPNENHQEASLPQDENQETEKKSW